LLSTSAYVRTSADLSVPEVHSVLDAVAGMVVLAQRKKQEQLSRSKRIEGWRMWQGQCPPFQLLDHILEKKRQLNCCAVTVAEGWCLAGGCQDGASVLADLKRKNLAMNRGPQPGLVAESAGFRAESSA
jgi:hypothetical protein